MGFSYRKRINLGKGSSLNVSGRGVSATKRFGPITINSRGRITIRLGKGLVWRL
jgi:hypothetical protein